MFKTIGYFEEYVIEGKFIGLKVCEEQPEREIGFYGKRILTAETNIVLENNKKIKAGQKYYTRYYPMNGRIKK
jgi:hypothetical protein